MKITTIVETIRQEKKRDGYDKTILCGKNFTYNKVNN
jgi:hypothetical protein